MATHTKTISGWIDLMKKGGAINTARCKDLIIGNSLPAVRSVAVV